MINWKKMAVTPCIVVLCLILMVSTSPGESSAESAPPESTQEVSAQANRQIAPSSLPVPIGATPAMVPAGGPPNPYYSVETITLSDGRQVDRATINGPAKPPPGYELERAPVMPSALNQQGIASSLSVPAYDWVFGCSAVSASMIGAYFDRNGLPNIYTGPTNSGVMPMDNSVWPTWKDGTNTTYPGNPLAASRNGSDGRTIKGSIDDYWVAYESTAADPYITGGWTQHTWGDAFGDYMKTSQSAYKNTDGSTTFYTYTSLATPLTCATMKSEGIAEEDGTYGRKLFYEARGYTVTECYNQKTDNNGGAFSFASYKAQIDAGHPVLLNLKGHSIVGIGYLDPSTVYIHDTWDYLTHEMTWGGSYSGMQLLSVSIVNPAGGPPKPTITGLNPLSATPGGPGFTLTVNGTNFVSGSVVQWNGSPRATTYVNSTELTAAITGTDIAAPGTASVTVVNPEPGGGTSNAMSFLVGTPKKVYLPLVMKRYPPVPEVPVLNAIANPDGDGNYTVSWNASTDATSYTLQEDDNAGFSSPETRYAGPGTSWDATGMAVGTYYYRVQASNSWGTSAWSATQSTTVSPAVGWTTIVSTDFEGAWPDPWDVSDNDGATGGEYYWGKRNCRPYAGGYSGWGVGAGAQGASLGCGANYPDYADSWMVYGPFSLQNATAADLKFKLWLKSQYNYDGVCRLASTDGTNFDGYCTSGDSQGWIDRVLDLSQLSQLGNLLGQPDVWIALVFSSDSDTTYAEGGYVDNIVLRKCPSGGNCPAGVQMIPGDSQVIESSVHMILPR